MQGLYRQLLEGLYRGLRVFRVWRVLAWDPWG